MRDARIDLHAPKPRRRRARLDSSVHRVGYVQCCPHGAYDIKIRGQSEAALQYGFIDLWLPCCMVVDLLIQSPGIAHLNVAFGFSISGKMDVYVSSAYGTAPRIQTTVSS